MKGLTEHTYHLDFQKSIAGEFQSAKTSLKLSDWQKIQQSNKTWRYAQMMAANDELQAAQVYLQISGLVMHAANRDKNQPGPWVWFYTSTEWAPYDDHQNLFMSTSVGDYLLALDAPFKLNFDRAGEGSKLDADGGIWAVYAFKYVIEGYKGIVFKQAGISMMQHLTYNGHQNQLRIFCAQRTPHIAQFSTKIAVKQAEE